MATTECGAQERGIYMGSDGSICHSSCWQPLEYHGTRGGLEVAFYCPGCIEHLTLPLRSLPSIPMSPRGWATGTLELQKGRAGQIGGGAAL